MLRDELDVPLNEDDEVQRLGARWDPERRIWFIPDGVDAEPFAKWRVMDDRTTLTLEQLTADELARLEQSKIPDETRELDHLVPDTW